MIDFLYSFPYLHIFSEGEFRIDKIGKETKISVAMSKDELKKLRRVIDEEDNFSISN